MLLLVELALAAGAVLPNPPLCSPELASDLSDSERRFAGKDNAEFAWSLWRGPGCDFELYGRGRPS
jgi:hypothetical protein